MPIGKVRFRLVALFASAGKEHRDEVREMFELPSHDSPSRLAVGLLSRNGRKCQRVDALRPPR